MVVFEVCVNCVKFCIFIFLYLFICVLIKWVICKLLLLSLLKFWLMCLFKNIFNFFENKCVIDCYYIKILYVIIYICVLI